jgi:hypothetical protein
MKSVGKSFCGCIESLDDVCVIERIHGELLTGLAGLVGGGDLKERKRIFRSSAGQTLF